MRPTRATEEQDRSAPHEADPVGARRPLARGFTLVEILVALAIVAVALGAGMRALIRATDDATLLKQRTLALWVAQNRLARNQLATPWPAIGQQSGTADQAGTVFVWRETITATPNPAFRKIDIAVAEVAQPDYALALISGYLGQPPLR